MENGMGEKKNVFHKGDMVVYGGNGVCRIEEISRQSFCGETREYYVLRSLYCAGETVFVPTDNATLTGKMYPALTRDQIDALLLGLPETEPYGTETTQSVTTVSEPDWIESDEERKNRFDAILASGDRKALLDMLRTLYIHKEKQEKRGKKLHIADERCFREGEKRISEEFAYGLQIDPAQVGEYIRNVLMKNA